MDDLQRCFMWIDSTTQPPSENEGLVLVSYPPGLFDEMVGTSQAIHVRAWPKDYPYWAPMPWGVINAHS